MTSCHQNCNIKEDRGKSTMIDEVIEDPKRYLDDMEDEMLAKKKVRLTGKYKEKRYIP
jgi:predicted DNA-binding protein